MENVTEAGNVFGRDRYFEECGVITEQAMNELIERVKERGEIEKTEPFIDIKESVHVELAGLRDAAWEDLVKPAREVDRYLCDLTESIKYATSAVKEFSLSADFAAGSAKAFIAAWRDGKWVPTGNRSSRRKQGVGGKRW